MAVLKRNLGIKRIGPSFPIYATDVEIQQQSELCRVEIENGIFGGYKKDILTENLTDRETAILICSICEGIMREACISSSGEQFCSCCEVLDPNCSGINYKTIVSRKPRNSYVKQTPDTPVRNMIELLKCSCPLSVRGCQWLGTLMKCEEHLDQCGYVKNTCTLGCGAVLQRNVHKEETRPESTVACEHCKRELKRDGVPTHIGVCPKLKLSCEMKCGEAIPRQDMAQHMEHRCCLAIEKCELGCGMKFTRSELKIHVSDTCVQRLVPCKHCNVDVKFCEKRNHLSTCPRWRIPCDLKCGKTIPRQDMTQHMEQKCCLVIETCELGCGMKFTRSELKIHVSDTCVQRLVPCKHCNVDVKFCKKRNHLSTCPRWRIPCDLKCGKTIPRQDMAQHLNNECGMVVEMCELGCGIQLTRKTLKEHQTDTCELRKIQCEYCNGDIRSYDMSAHLNICRKMKVLCDLACGEALCLEDMAQHLEVDCPEKEIECPFAIYNCGVGLMKRRHLKNHLVMNISEHMEMKLGVVEIIYITSIMRISAHNDAICSINDTTKLEWKIGDITEFMETLHQLPGRNQVGRYILNIYFHEQHIYASFKDKLESHQTTIVAKFLICLYSNIKLEVVKQYKHDVSQFLTGSVSQEIAYISDSDIQELSYKEGTQNIILYMYITIM